MADQKLNTIDHVTYLLEKFCICIFFRKSWCLGTFQLFFLTSMVFWHYLSKFAQRFIKKIKDLKKF